MNGVKISSWLFFYSFPNYNPTLHRDILWSALPLRTDGTRRREEFLFGWYPLFANSE